MYVLLSHSVLEHFLVHATVGPLYTAHTLHTSVNQDLHKAWHWAPEGIHQQMCSVGLRLPLSSLSTIADVMCLGPLPPCWNDACRHPLMKGLAVLTHMAWVSEPSIHAETASPMGATGAGHTGINRQIDVTFAASSLSWTSLSVITRVCLSVWVITVLRSFLS